VPRRLIAWDTEMPVIASELRRVSLKWKWGYAVVVLKPSLDELKRVLVNLKFSDLFFR
jgi:hypothetical protein